ncbi:MAG: NADH:ubiquinone oxidoreductase subunit NDUFA12 [Alphaproteobacteria bacterium]
MKCCITGKSVSLFKMFGGILGGVLTNTGILALTLKNGVKVGQDEFGNLYFKGRKTPANQRQRRWVIYAGEPEASAVPPEWHAWLHHTVDDVPAAENPLRRSWQKPHQPNLTGTSQAYFPEGHLLATGKRAKATGDYEAWSPAVDVAAIPPSTTSH